jgi:plastocyanin
MARKQLMRRSILAASIAAAFTASSCGGSSGSPAGGSGNPAPPAGASTISILGQRGAQSFTPNPASISQGSTLVWRNTDNVVHHIVMNDGSLDAGDIAPGAFSPALRLSTDGANYHCTIHPTMVGSINRSTGEPPPCTGVYCEP